MLAEIGGFGRCMRALAPVALGAVVVCAGAFQAHADKALHGVALVIGQSAYRDLHALPNPVNDARAVSRLLGDLGFDVTDEARRNSELARDAFNSAGQMQEEVVFAILLQQVELAELSARLEEMRRTAR